MLNRMVRRPEFLMFSTAANAKDDAVPLCVDLDGTLVRTDMLVGNCGAVAQAAAVRSGNAAVLADARGAYLKRQIAKGRTVVDPAHLPYHHEFIDFLAQNAARGGRHSGDGVG